MWEKIDMADYIGRLSSGEYRATSGGELLSGGFYLEHGRGGVSELRIERKDDGSTAFEFVGSDCSD